MQDWHRLLKTWHATLEAVEGLRGYTTLQAARSAGITHSNVWGLAIDAPASPADIQRTEACLGMALPPALSAFFLNCASSVHFRWQLHDDFEPPPPFQSIFCGGFSLSLSELQENEMTRREWVERSFPNPHDPYEVIWHEKLAVIPVMNGDYIGIDLRTDHHGEVVYLSHDDGDGHGYVLGADILDFLRRWTPLGCPGPEDWQWLPFTSSETSMLEPAGEAARQWQRILGLKAA